MDAGSMNKAMARGKVRVEGKDSLMADGDVVEFHQINVPGIKQ